MSLSRSEHDIHAVAGQALEPESAVEFELGLISPTGQHVRSGGGVLKYHTGTTQSYNIYELLL